MNYSILSQHSLSYSGVTSSHSDISGNCRNIKLLLLLLYSYIHTQFRNVNNVK